MGGDEVLEDGHPLAEVAAHGDVDDPARRVGHEAAHGAQLADVALVPAGTRIGHHRHRAGGVEVVHHPVREVLRGLLPDVDDRLVPLVLGDEAALELGVDPGDLEVGGGQELRLLGWDGDVVDRDRHAAAGGVLEPDPLDAVHEVGGLDRPEGAVAAVDEAAAGPGAELLVGEAQAIRQDLVEDDPADGRADSPLDERVGLVVPGPDHRLDRLVEGHRAESWARIASSSSAKIRVGAFVRDARLVMVR